MSLTLKNVPLPTASRTITSKYNFAVLTVGGPALAETDVIDVKKALSKVSSALVGYRKRTGDKSKFSVRPYKQEDGTDAVGCWKTKDAPAAAAAVTEDAQA